MTDYASGASDRNFAIRGGSCLRTLRELLLIGLPVVAVAGGLLFYAWTRTELVATGYETQALQSDEQELIREQQKLVIEEEQLKHPERIGAIALNELGMTRLRPSQILPSSVQDIRRDAADSLAMAAVGGPRKAGARN